MTTIYLAGPMRGIRLFNFPAFDAAAHDLRKRGYSVISPADLDRDVGFDPLSLGNSWDWTKTPDSFSLADAVDRDLTAVRQADELCLLPDWNNSRGAKAEKALAEWIGKPVWEYKPEGILQEAARITSGDRQAQYGPPDQDFRRTAGMWSELFAHMLRDGERFEPQHVAMAMIALKMSRQIHQKKRDNWTDLAGYAHCGNLCDEASQ